MDNKGCQKLKGPLKPGLGMSSGSGLEGLDAQVS